MDKFRHNVKNNFVGGLEKMTKDMMTGITHLLKTCKTTMGKTQEREAAFQKIYDEIMNNEKKIDKNAVAVAKEVANKVAGQKSKVKVPAGKPKVAGKVKAPAGKPKVAVLVKAAKAPVATKAPKASAEAAVLAKSEEAAVKAKLLQ